MSFAGNTVIAGGTGLIGSALARELRSRHHKVTVLSRSGGDVSWDGATMGEWRTCLEGASTLINLCGKNINCRPTPLNRKTILDSRIRPTSVLLEAVKNCSRPPPVFIQASAVGYYGDTASECREDSPAGKGFLPDVCTEWEKAFGATELTRTRKVTARFGVVLSNEGGAFPVLRKLTSLFLGGSAGDGSQYLSWIHIQDVTAVLLRMIEDPSMEGIYNITAPDAVTNAEFMKALRNNLRRPWSPPVPSACIRLSSILFDINPDLALTGQNAVPARLIENGFKFKYPDLKTTISNL